jgi:hypothetical protein
MHTPRSRWLLWATGTLATFTALETHALRAGDHAGTLSASLRLLLGIHPRSNRRWIMIPIFVGFLGWFLTHILTDTAVEDQ